MQGPDILEIASHSQIKPTSFVDRMSVSAGAVSGCVMLLASFFIVYEVLSRALLGHATVWVYDVTSYMLLWFAFLSCAFVLHRRHHLNVDLFVSTATPRVQLALEIIGLLAIAVFSVLAFVYATSAMLHTYMSGELEPTIIRTPVYVIYLGMVIGLGLLVLQTGRELMRAGAQWKTVARSDAAARRDHLWFYLAVFAIVLAAGIYLLSKDYAAFGIVLILSSLLFFGVPIFAGLALTGIIGLYFVFGPETGFPQVAQIGYKAMLSNTLLAIPLYVLAGNILQAGQIGPELFKLAAAWFGHVRGGYAVATVLACGIFAAISGSSVATAATIGALAIPEMLKQGYDRRFVYGLVAAGGTLGILIPPSTPMILYSGMTNESTGGLFMGGVVPGILLLVILAIYAVWACGPNTTTARASWAERFAALREAVWGLLAPVIVLVGIYTGAFTPTEAAAVVVVYALVVSLLRRTIRIQDLWEIMASGVLVSCMIMMIIVGAMIMGVVTTVNQFPQELQSLVEFHQLSPWTVFSLLVVLYVILGMFLEVVSILLITLPIVYPLVTSLGFNGLWFGVVLVILMELALITPPVGLNLFTVQGVTRAPLAEIIMGVIPFIGLIMVAFALVVAFPDLALMLPQSMGLGR